MLTANFHRYVAYLRWGCSWLGLLLLTGVAFAIEPEPPNVNLIIVQQSRLRIQNKLNAPVIVQLAPGAQATVDFAPFTFTLQPKQRQDFELARFGLGQGRQVLHVDATLFDAAGAPIPGVHPFLYQPFLVNAGVFKPVSYSQAFLGGRRRIKGSSDDPAIDLGGGYIDHTPVSPLAFSPTSLPVGVEVIPTHAPDPLIMAAMPSKQLSLDTTHVPGPCPPPCGIPSVVESPVRDEHPSSPDAGINLRGNFSILYPDNTYHATWAWVVRVWLFVGNSYAFLGWNYVDGGGNWQIGPVPPSSVLYIEYRPANRFLQLQDAKGNIYAWGQNIFSGSGDTDIGSWYLDSSNNGDLPGLNAIYGGGTDVWVKFSGNGMNALRDKPIEVTFPNTLTSGHCIYDKDSNGKSVPQYAWSCSQSSDGKIWLIPAHAAPFVIRHELAHSIHSWYWGGLPGGKPHSLGSCYDNDTGMVEGFADYVGYWTQFAPDETNPVAGYASYNIEAQPNWACMGQTNETWVSTTFWDMYDVWNDGPDPNSRYDSWLYNSQAQPISLFLGNKVNSMSDFLNIVKIGDDSYWQGEDEKLFRLGTIIP